MKSFDHGKLKHVETEEKNPLPTASTLMEEMRPETLPDVSGVAGFDAGKLKHVETEEKNVLPTSDGKLFCRLYRSTLISFPPSSTELQLVPADRSPAWCMQETKLFFRMKN